MWPERRFVPELVEPPRGRVAWRTTAGEGALELGVTPLHTPDKYGRGHNQEHVGRAIAQTVLGSVELSLPAAVYGVLMFFIAFGFGFLIRERRTAAAAEPTPVAPTPTLAAAAETGPLATGENHGEDAGSWHGVGVKGRVVRA